MLFDFLLNSLREQQSSSKENAYLSKFKVLIRVLFDGNDDGSITVREFAEVFCQKMGFDMHITENVCSISWFHQRQCQRVCVIGKINFPVIALYIVHSLYSRFGSVSIKREKETFRWMQRLSCSRRIIRILRLTTLWISYMPLCCRFTKRDSRKRRLHSREVRN